MILDHLLHNFLSAITLNWASQQIDPAQALLSQLHEIKTPAPIGAWPPAVGWWVVVITSTLFIASISYFLLSRHVKNRYRKIALEKLANIQVAKETTNANLIAEINGLLKQVFFTAYPGSRNNISSLFGESWYKQLVSTIDSKKLDKCNYPYEQWANAQYSANGELNRDDLFQFAKSWIQLHSPMSKQELENRLNSQYPSSTVSGATH